MTGCNNVEMINFKNLTLTNKPNYYLACPENYCNVSPNEFTTQYPVNVEKLQLAWQQMLDKQPQINVVKSIPSEHKYQYVQYSRIFRFPDYIDVQFIPIAHNMSTLAIYSRSRFGYYDFRVNEKRVKNWLSILANYLVP